MSIIFLSILITYWGFNLKANNLDNDENNVSSSKYDKPPRNGNFDWEEIEVISEPIPGLNISINDSCNPAITVEDDKICVDR